MAQNLSFSRQPGEIVLFPTCGISAITKQSTSPVPERIGSSGQDENMLSNQFSRRFVDIPGGPINRTPLTADLHNPPGADPAVHFPKVVAIVQCCVLGGGKENSGEKCYRCSLKTVVRRLRHLEKQLICPETRRLESPKRPIFRPTSAAKTATIERLSRPSTAMSRPSTAASTRSSSSPRSPASIASWNFDRDRDRLNGDLSRPTTAHTASPRNPTDRPITPYSQLKLRRSASPVTWQPTLAQLERAKLLESCKPSRRYPDGGPSNPIPLRRVIR